MTLSFNLGRKGQVLMIIGVIMSLSLYLISMTTNFEAALRRRTLTGMDETTVLRNIGNEIRETYDIAIKDDASFENVNESLVNFTRFLEERSGTKNIGSLVSKAVHHNESETPEIKVGVHNHLGRELKEVEIGGYQCNGGSLAHGDTCSVVIDPEGEKYELEVYYLDERDDRGYTKTYSGYAGDAWNNTALFYRIELEMGSTKLVDEGRAWSKSIQ